MKIEKIHTLFLNCNQKIYTDTRKPLFGGMFFALKGPGFNGNNFASLALEQGASFVVVDEHTDTPDTQTILVSSVLETLQKLAYFHRMQSSAEFIAIGGSNGKTTTKELLNKVLSLQYNVHATPGNFNNHIGLPLTLLSMPLSTQICLIELGTNRPGDMAELCEIAHPTAGILTNIGKEHLEGFGSIEAIALEESHLYKYLLDNNGKVFVNNDDPWLHSMSARFSHPFRYSISDFIVKQSVPSILVETLEGVIYASPLSGIHNISNITAARSIGLHFGIADDKIAKAIASYVPDNMRSEWRQTEKNLIFLDAYNANPSSMMVAIDTLKSYEGKNKIAILGDMFELGSHALQEHKNIYAYAMEAGFDRVITVGQNFSSAHLSGDSFEKIDDLIHYLSKSPIHDSVLLLKASRGMKLESLLPYL